MWNLKHYKETNDEYIDDIPVKNSVKYLGIDVIKKYQIPKRQQGNLFPTSKNKDHHEYVALA